MNRMITTYIEVTFVLTLLSVLSNDNYLGMISVLCNVTSVLSTDKYVHKEDGHYKESMMLKYWLASKTQ